MNQLPEWLTLLAAGLNLIATTLRLAAHHRRADRSRPEAKPAQPGSESKEDR